MNIYKIYFNSDTVANGEVFINTEMMAENVDDARRKFKEKYPYDKIFEITMKLR